MLLKNDMSGKVQAIRIEMIENVRKSFILLLVLLVIPLKGVAWMIRFKF